MFVPFDSSANSQDSIPFMLHLFISDLELATGLPLWWGFAFIFILGAAVGSFLNVVIHRVPQEQSVVFPTSACPTCGNAIKAYDNIPILSWLILGGKCRSCKAPISARYPAVELLNALLWVLVFWQIGFTPMLPVALIFVSVMAALMFIDAEHMILPNVITYPLFVAVIVLRIAFPLMFAYPVFSDMQYAPLASIAGSYHPVVISLIGTLLGALAGGGSLWLVGELWKRLRGVDAMGLGDVKMMLGVGALLGWRLTFLSIFLGAFAGALIGGIYISMKKDKTLQAHIPFGIFLGIGSIVALLFGERMIAWYLNTFIP